MTITTRDRTLTTNRKFHKTNHLSKYDFFSDSAVHEGSSRTSSDYQKKFEKEDSSSVILPIDQESEENKIPLHKRQTYAISYWRQFIILLTRSSTCIFRDMVRKQILFRNTQKT